MAAQQVDATVDAGATAIRYGDSLATGAATLAPSIRIATPRATLDAAASIAELGTSAWAAQGSIDGSLFTPQAAGLRGELVANAGGSDREDGIETGQLEALGRVHLMRGGWGVWAGGGAGRAWDGSSGHTLVLGDAGAWLRRGSLVTVITATPTAVDDSIRYTDVVAAARFTRTRVELGAAVGARAGHGLVASTGGRAWGALTGVVWLASRLGIVASAGTYPPDLAQGFPDGGYVSLGVRLSVHPAWRSALATSAGVGFGTSANGESPDGVERLVVESTGDRRTIRIRAPRAARVELAGDITDWTPVALSPSGDGWWTTTLLVRPGAHQVSLRLDGKAWTVPPGLVTVTDEFGGTAGLWDVH